MHTKISGVQVVTFFHIENCFINTDPQKYTTFIDFLKITFQIWQNDYLNPRYFHMDANIFQFGQNSQDDTEDIAVGGTNMLYLLIKNILK